MAYISGNSLANSLTGTTSADTILGNGGNDLINAGSGNDYLRGGDGYDTLIGGTGNDTMLGDTGNDLFREFYVNGSDAINGGSGIDTVSYDDNSTTAPVVLNLSTGTATRSGYTDTLSLIERVSGSDSTQDSINAAGDTDGFTLNLATGAITGANRGFTHLYQFEHVTGGSGSDIISGSTGNNNLSGGTGNDTLSGGAGTNTLIGGVGDDAYILTSLTDNLTENAGEGTDTVFVGFSYNLLTHFENLSVTGSAHTAHTGTTVANAMTGNAGNNTLNGSTGNDTMVGGAGNDYYVVSEAGDVVTESSGQGTDTVESSVSFTLSDHIENLILTGSAVDGTGNSLNNTITGNTLSNDIYGGDGNDTLTAVGPDDWLRGEAGNDLLNGATDLDFWLQGGAGNDTIYGNGGGYEYLSGGDDNDLIYGVDDNDDALEGEAGNDTLIGNGGNDEFYGGDGDDYILGSEDSEWWIDAGAGNDTVYSNGGEDYVDGGDGDDYLDIRGNAVENYYLVAGSGNDTIYGSETGNNWWLEGGEGNDRITGGSGDDWYVFDVAFGVDTIASDTGGYDAIDFYVDTNITINLASGLASDGTNSVTFAGLVFEEAYGNTENDRIYGNSADNFINGYTGDDTISGGAGNDILLDNQSGDDAYADFTGNFGADTIDDDAGTDTLDLSNYTLSDVLTWTALDATDADTNVNHLLLTFTGGNTITLENYFNNTATTAQSSGQGFGLIETLVFADDANVDFAQIQYLTNPVKTGTNGDDTLIGTSLDESILGLDGNDTYQSFYSNFGVDSISDSSGTDTLNLSNYNLADVDSWYAGPGSGVTDLWINFNSGNSIQIENYFQPMSFPNAGMGTGYIETIIFADDSLVDLTQVLSIAINQMTLVGSTGDDNITGTPLRDYLFGFDGNDTLSAEGYHDFIYGGAGNDLLIGGLGGTLHVNEFYDVSGNDTFIGDIHDDIYNLQTSNIGSDVISDAGGTDEVSFVWEMYDDWKTTDVISWQGRDSNADTFIDQLFIDFGQGHSLTVENYFDNASASIAASGAGNGLIELIQFADGFQDINDIKAFIQTGTVGGRSSYLYNTYHYFDDNWGNITLTTGNGRDLYFNRVDTNLTVNLTSSSGQEITDGTNTVNWSNSMEFYYIHGGGGNDLLTGDFLDGGAGNDTLLGYSYGCEFYGGEGDDLLHGQSGNDQYDYSYVDETWGNDLIIDDGGIDKIILYRVLNFANSSFTVNLNSDSGNEVTDGISSINWSGDAIENVEIQTSNAYIIGNSSANYLKGFNQSDTLIGGTGNDSLDGNSGNDILEGGLGNDSLYGYDGNDVYQNFIGSFGVDTILDANGQDKLDLSNFNLADAESWSLTNTDSLLITFSGSNTITIDNYFNNTGTAQGTGYIETIIFADDAEVDFTQVQGLIT